jgi:RNA polymerase sigma factor (sigma-70 family)
MPVKAKTAVSRAPAQMPPGPGSPSTPLPASAFEEFFRGAYQPLVRDVIFAGGNPHEAEDAVSAAMAEVLQRWDTIENPRAYARRAAISNLIKNKQRGLPRIRERLVQRGDVPLEYDLDPGLMVWEQQEWVPMLLKSLPRAQRDVLACMVDMFTQQEIAQLLGKTEAAVRQNLRAARKRLARCLAETESAKEG